MSVRKPSINSGYAHLAVQEPVHAPHPSHCALLPAEQAFDIYLRSQARGRLEQEFLPMAVVVQAIDAWLHSPTEPTDNALDCQK